MTPESEWLGLVRAQDWGALSGRMLFYPQAEQAALLDALRQLVPKTGGPLRPGSLCRSIREHIGQTVPTARSESSPQFPPRNSGV